MLWVGGGTVMWVWCNDCSGLGVRRSMTARNGRDAAASTGRDGRRSVREWRMSLGLRKDEVAAWLV